MIELTDTPSGIELTGVLESKPSPPRTSKVIGAEYDEAMEESKELRERIADLRSEMIDAMNAEGVAVKYFGVFRAQLRPKPSSRRSNFKEMERDGVLDRYTTTTTYHELQLVVREDNG